MTEPDAMKAAIETMLETVRKHDVAGVNFVAESKWCRCGWERRIGVNGLDADEWASEHARHHQEMILRALLDGGYVVLTEQEPDCKRCGGTGRVYLQRPRPRWADAIGPCPDCSGGQDGTRVNHTYDPPSPEEQTRIAARQAARRLPAESPKEPR